MCEKNKRALALGYFDGLHVGHTAVLSAALAQKQNGLSPAVLLFDRHPVSVLSGEPVPCLLTPDDRDAILTRMGFELIRLPFAQIKDLSPARFIREILCDALNCGFVSCGYNYTFGKNGAGTRQALEELCAALDVGISVSDRVAVNGTPVSSSAIRRAITEGDPETARAMLGRPVTFATPVFNGDRRGRRLGAPTVNQLLPDGFVTPKFGVYASFAQIQGHLYAAVTDIGNRPTFGGGSVRCETHIFDFSGDLYNKTVRLYLLAFLRADRRFDSFDALKEQIGADILQARAFTEHCDFPCPGEEIDF